MKRIILCAEGTWGSPTSAHPSNVARLSRAVAPCTTPKDPSEVMIEQVVFYDWGIGSETRSASAALTGNGIDKNIQDCYRFLAHNYSPGDEIFLFGFSRGAYTVRSLAGLIRNCGLVKSANAARIPEAYALYRRRGNASAPSSSKAAEFRQQYAHADRTEIQFIGVWDTVGSLGIPIPFWGTLDKRSFLFHDTALSSSVKHARHALALDERRSDFDPTLWQAKQGTTLKQVWFAGEHTDIGGGNADPSFADISLGWMAAEAQACGLALDLESELSRLVSRETQGHFSQPSTLRNAPRGLFAVRPKASRRVTGAIHLSAVQRHKKDIGGYRKQADALNAVLRAVDGDWNRIEIEG